MFRYFCFYNIINRFCFSLESWDHPRSCGKDVMAEDLLVCFGGSPPLVRERRVRVLPEPHIFGITPARAGKTTARLPLSGSAQDHPRSCGKDTLSEQDIHAVPGSPPLVRERQKRGQIYGVKMRITPARAGKTIFI